MFCDPRSLVLGDAFRERGRVSVEGVVGKRGRFRQMAIGSPLTSDADVARELRRLSLVPAIRTDNRSLSMFDPPAHNVDLINAFQPDLVTSCGSYLEALFIYLYETGRPFHRPAAVRYGADVLSERGRALISGHFGIPVLSTYGAIESFQIGFECDEHVGFHLNVDLHPLRIVDADGADVATGESGQVIVSDLANRGTVLINYRLGDIASRLVSPCPCGRTLPLLSFLEGRADDWLDLASGERVHPQAIRRLFAVEHEVWSYQVVQRRSDAFDVAVVATGDADVHPLRARLASSFRERFGAETVTDIAFVDSLPRTRSGKVRPVISSRVAGVPDREDR